MATFEVQANSRKVGLMLLDLTKNYLLCARVKLFTLQALVVVTGP
jgi:hypothetical protein